MTATVQARLAPPRRNVCRLGGGWCHGSGVGDGQLPVQQERILVFQAGEASCLEAIVRVSRHPSTPGFPDTHRLRGFQTPIDSVRRKVNVRGSFRHPPTPPSTRGSQTPTDSVVSRHPRLSRLGKSGEFRHPPTPHLPKPIDGERFQILTRFGRCGVSRHPRLRGFPDTHRLRGFQTPIDSGVSRHPSTPGLPDTHRLRDLQISTLPRGICRGICRHHLTPGINRSNVALRGVLFSVGT